jgi:UDP-glucose:(heptosyl)LPS alpha-1,3-glucosyltransferase
METWRGGAETSTSELARLLAARGHAIHFVTTTNVPSPPDAVVHPIRVSASLGPLRTATFIRKASGFIRKNTFDLVHAIAPLPSADVYQPRGGLVRETLQRNIAMRSTAAGRAMKRAMIAMNLKQRSLLELEKDIFRKDGPLILCVSRYVAEQCRAFYHAGPPRVRVVFNGVSAAISPPTEQTAARASVRGEHHLSEDLMLLLFVAHNFRLKGLDPLIETLARLVRGGLAGLHLLVVGRDNPVRYQRRIEELGLQTFVTFTGATQRMAAFFHAADVCVHPTYYDPCSRVVLEALSYGLPCVTTRFNGASEVMTDGQEGFVVDSPDNLDAWVDRIKQLSFSGLRRKMSASALLLRSRLSMTRHVEELDAIFAEVVDGKRQARRSGRTRSR